MQVINLSKNNVIVQDLIVADNFFTRLRGLLGMKYLQESRGICIIPCNSIHMFFMKFSIDVVFVDKDNKVCELQENLRPWQISKLVKKSSYVLELPVNSIKKYMINIDDVLKIID